MRSLLLLLCFLSACSAQKVEPSECERKLRICELNVQILMHKEGL